MSIYSYEMESDEEYVDRDEVEYHDALDAAHDAGEPFFTFDEFKARTESHRRLVAATASTIPAPSEDADDDIPF